MADNEPTCAKCNETAAAKNVANLQVCARCKTTRYCGRDCQTADWKTHKKECSKIAAKAFKTNTMHGSTYSAPRLKDLEEHVPNPFTRLDQGKYLHDRPQTDVYKLLIDSFRMRQADDFTLESKIMPRSVYAGAPSSIEPFRQYLEKASARQKLLPPWWTREKGEECATFSESGAWNNLAKKATKQEMIEHYGDDKMPMQLRMLAEMVYGTGTMGQNGSGVRKLMAGMESGGSENSQHMSMFDVSR
ncbi:hypothetical protein GQ44DRAFT_738659 [Phaeosphaeriaceae sp. PMI808]|nr:hypothetical protein GQ44DRAFT_738659 [Phaeosphaeriaceae sp. PMI808]